MKVKIWGCRGSLATPGAETVHYGGNTSCVEVTSAAGATIVLDAGTGVRHLGIDLVARGVRHIDLLLTHLHLDHIEGLGFFAPLFDPGCSVHIHGPRPEGGSLRERITGYLSPPFFPVPFDRIPATVDFEEVWKEGWALDGVAVLAAPVQHPGPTVGYRLDEGSRSLAYVPDNEPALDRDAGLGLADKVDLLLHDAQYTEAEYASRSGWGHAALPDFAQVVRSASPRRALMFHHDPSHSDSKLEEMEAVARELAEHEQVALGREGLEIDLT
jgi:phosphoribosyl 1,2-cyclic phosphodiesterase